MTEAIYISPSISSPEVSYDSADKAIKFTGQSYPANSVEFYKPVFDWFANILDGANADLNRIIFKLKYYNTSSSKQFARIFKVIEESKIASDVVVEWLYEDDDNEMYEAGIRFSMFSNLKFEVKQYLSE
jgi:hypothetical protein